MNGKHGIWFNIVTATAMAADLIAQTHLIPPIAGIIVNGLGNIIIHSFNLE